MLRCVVILHIPGVFGDARAIRTGRRRAASSPEARRSIGIWAEFGGDEIVAAAVNGAHNEPRLFKLVKVPVDGRARDTDGAPDDGAVCAWIGDDDLVDATARVVGQRVGASGCNQPYDKEGPSKVQRFTTDRAGGWVVRKLR